jgi:hypothetical protein
VAGDKPRTRFSDQGAASAKRLLFSSPLELWPFVVSAPAPLPPSRLSHKLFSCLVVVQMSGRSSSSRGREKVVRKGPPIVWEGSLGPDSFEEPIEQFSLESKSDFTRERPLRSYDNRMEDCPKCHDGKDCVVERS